jgi:hypothetical protein
MTRGQCCQANPRSGQASRLASSQEQDRTRGKGTVHQRLLPIHLLFSTDFHFSRPRLPAMETEIQAKQSSRTFNLTDDYICPAGRRARSGSLLETLKNPNFGELFWWNS